MIIKINILIILFSFSLNASSQTLKLDSLRMPTLVPIQSVRTSDSQIVWVCHAPRSNSNEGALIIVNNKRFKNTLLINFYNLVDIGMIKNIQVLSNQSDSAKMYGKEGKNGVIIITTRSNIEWVVATDILRKQPKLSTKATKAFLIQVNDSTVIAATDAYLPKQLIKTIEIQKDKLHFFNDKQFTGLARITFSNTY